MPKLCGRGKASAKITGSGGFETVRKVNFPPHKGRSGTPDQPQKKSSRTRLESHEGDVCGSESP
jgi:hypothetical protein